MSASQDNTTRSDATEWPSESNKRLHDMLRLTFMVYWTDTPPSAEVFFIHAGRFASHRHPDITQLEYTVKQVLCENEQTDRVQSNPVLISVLPVRLNANEFAAQNWRVLSPQPDTSCL